MKPILKAWWWILVIVLLATGAAGWMFYALSILGEGQQ